MGNLLLKFDHFYLDFIFVNNIIFRGFLIGLLQAISKNSDYKSYRFVRVTQLCEFSIFHQKYMFVA